MIDALHILNPLAYANWDERIAHLPGVNFFHTQAWAKVLNQSYGYQPCYFTEIKNDQITSLQPLMSVESWLTGKRGVALPFSDHCAPLFSGNLRFSELTADMLAYGKKRGWKYVEWRGANIEQEVPSTHYKGHLLDISLPEAELFSRFRSSNQRNIKKARKQKVHIECSSHLEGLEEFYRLNGLTRKRHGIPPQPRKFFRQVFEQIIRPGKGMVLLARYEQQVIAAGVFFSYAGQVLYKYGASDSRFQALRANNLLMWEAIRWAADRGAKTFDFGRTDSNSQGLLQFKRGWGAIEKSIFYYKYDFSMASFIKENSSGGRLVGISQKLPTPLLELAGNLLYRHVG